MQSGVVSVGSGEEISVINGTGVGAEIAKVVVGEIGEGRVGEGTEPEIVELEELCGTIGNEAGTVEAENAMVVIREVRGAGGAGGAGAGVGAGDESKTELEVEVSPGRGSRSDHRNGSRESRSESDLREGTSLPERR